MTLRTYRWGTRRKSRSPIPTGRRGNMKLPTATQLLQHRPSCNADHTISSTSGSTEPVTCTPQNPNNTEISSQLKILVPIGPEQIAEEDPTFRTSAAAGFLGVSAYCLQKWRQRDQGPDFLRYRDGTIRYLLSSLIQFKAAHRVVPSRQARTQRSR